MTGILQPHHQVDRILSTRGVPDPLTDSSGQPQASPSGKETLGARSGIELGNSQISDRTEIRTRELWVHSRVTNQLSYPCTPGLWFANTAHHWKTPLDDNVNLTPQISLIKGYFVKTA